MIGWRLLVEIQQQRKQCNKEHVNGYYMVYGIFMCRIHALRYINDGL